MVNLSDKNKDFSETSLKRWALIFAFSAALHAPLFVRPADVSAIGKNLSGMVSQVAFCIKRALYGDKKAEAEYKSMMKDVIADDPDLKGFDYERFFLRAEYYEGSISSEEELLSYDKEFSDRISEFQDQDEFALLNGIVDSWGEYEIGRSKVSSILAGNGGNCAARARYTLSVLSRVAPNLRTRIMITRVGDMMHEVLIVKVDDDWYKVELGLPKVNPDMVRGTMILEPADYAKMYAGEKVGGRLIGQPDEDYGDADAIQTDDTFDFPFNSRKIRPIDVEEDRKISPIKLRIIKKKIPDTEISSDVAEDTGYSLTAKDVLDAQLTGDAFFEAGCKSFEPLRGIPLKHVYFMHNPKKNPSFPSFEPFSDAPPEFASALAIRNPDLSELKAQGMSFLILTDSAKVSEYEHLWPIESTTFYPVSDQDAVHFTDLISSNVDQVSIYFNDKTQGAEVDFAGLKQSSVSELVLNLDYDFNGELSYVNFKNTDQLSDHPFDRFEVWKDVFVREFPSDLILKAKTFRYHGNDLSSITGRIIARDVYIQPTQANINAVGKIEGMDSLSIGPYAPGASNYDELTDVIDLAPLEGLQVRSIVIPSATSKILNPQVLLTMPLERFNGELVDKNKMKEIVRNNWMRYGYNCEDRACGVAE